jgi:hypothetical protein
VHTTFTSSPLLKLQIFRSKEMLQLLLTKALLNESLEAVLVIHDFLTGEKDSNKTAVDSSIQQ